MHPSDSLCSFLWKAQFLLDQNLDTTGFHCNRWTILDFIGSLTPIKSHCTPLDLDNLNSFFSDAIKGLLECILAWWLLMVICPKDQVYVQRSLGDDPVGCGCLFVGFYIGCLVGFCWMCIQGPIKLIFSCKSLEIQARFLNVEECSNKIDKVFFEFVFSTWDLKIFSYIYITAGTESEGREDLFWRLSASLRSS